MYGRCRMRSITRSGAARRWACRESSERPRHAFEADCIVNLAARRPVVNIAVTSARPASSRASRIPTSLPAYVQKLGANGILKPLEGHFRFCGSGFGSFCATEGVGQLRLSRGDPCPRMFQRRLEFVERRVRFLECRLGGIPRDLGRAKALFGQVQFVER